MSRNIHALVSSIFTVHLDGDVDCDGCCCQLDCLAELVATGAEWHALLPAVEAHLKCCADCREEFEALVAIIRAQNAGQLAT